MSFKNCITQASAPMKHTLHESIQCYDKAILSLDKIQDLIHEEFNFYEWFIYNFYEKK